MDLTGFDAYLAYSLPVAQAEINENPTIIGQTSNEEQEREEFKREA